MIPHEFIVPKNKPMPKKLEDNPLASPSISLIVGGTGSGKSTCLANLLIALQKLYDFDSGLFVTSNGRDPLLDAIEMPITTKPSDLQDYLTNVRQSKNGTRHLLCLDDIQGVKEFNIFSARSDFVKFLLSHRHYGSDPKKPGQYGTWVLLTAQTLKGSYSTTIRDQIKNFFLYPPRNPSHIKHYEELAQDPSTMRDAIAIAKARGKHNFVYVNKHNPMIDRYFINFQEPVRGFTNNDQEIQESTGLDKLIKEMRKN